MTPARRALALSLAALGVASALAAGSAPRMARSADPPWGLETQIEVLAAEVEDVDGPIADAFARIREIEQYTLRSAIDPISFAASAKPHAVPSGLFDLLVRAKTFCDWSDGAISPLVGWLYDLWIGAPALPRADAVREATQSAGCERILLDAELQTVQILAGSQIDLRDFTVGFAIDAAVEQLESSGVTNARVQIGHTQRAFGPGRDGHGWEIELPHFRSLSEPLKPIRLRDEAISIAGLRPLNPIAGDQYSSYIDPRTGSPTAGTTAVLAVTELAVDAFSLANALLVTGNHEGELRLGILSPPPSVLWLLGSPDGAPLLASYQWSKIQRR